MPEWLGKTIGNVRIERLLARGGMAEVYLGTHLNLERPVAIKLLHSYIEEEPTLLERFHREAKAVAGLRHSHIVQIFDFDTTDGHPYIVMEYLRGPTLATYLRNLHQRKKRIPSDQVARLLNELSAALDYAHEQGVIHRDIKPGNIMLHNKTDDIPLDKPLTDDVKAVITDFGLVRLINQTSQTASGLLSGTPAYMSPEQGRGDEIDHRTDIYSLGIVLYEMLAGRVPFEADSTLTVLYMHINTPPPPIPGIPARVQAVMDRALQKKPDDRYQSSQEMANDYYRAVGMTPQAEIIQRREPVGPVPIEAPAPAKPEPLPKPAPIAPEPSLKPASTEPEPLPKPIPPAPEPLPKPVPIVREQSWKPTPTEPKPIPKPKPAPTELPSKPARSRAGISTVLFSVIGLTVLAVVGYLIFFWWPPPPPTATAIPNTSTPLPSAIPSPRNPTNMVPIPADTYIVGEGKGDDYHAPTQRIPLDSFLIDRTQVTNKDYQQYLLAKTGAPTPVVWPAQTGEEKHPVRGVTWDQADAYCKWKNKRLPSEAEWEAAGRGPSKDPGKAPPLYPWGYSSNADEKAFDLPSDNTYEVGKFDFNRSPFGVYDMLGNVWEWVDEPYSSLPEGYRILRGVRYGNLNDLAYRVQLAPDDPIYVQFAGFRCATNQVSE